MDAVTQYEKNGTWDVPSFFLNLAKNPNDRSCHKVNIIDLAPPVTEDEKTTADGGKYWLQTKYNSYEGKPYTDLVKYVKAHCPPGFEVQASRVTAKGRILFKCSKYRSKNGPKCQFRFTLQFETDHNRYSINFPSGEKPGYCFQHICDPSTNLQKGHHQTMMSDEDEKLAYELFVKYQKTIQSKKMQRLVYIELSYEDFYTRFMAARTPTANIPTIWSVTHYIKKLEKTPAIIFDPYNQDLFNAVRGVRDLLEEWEVTKNLKAERYGNSTKEVENHPYLKCYLYSGDKASEIEWKYPGETGEERKMATLTDQEYGYLLTGEKAHYIDTDARGRTFWNKLDELGFPYAGACNYHCGEKKLSEEMSTFRGHCDIAHFGYVILTLLHGVTWTLLCVPKDTMVPKHSKDEFKSWRAANLPDETNKNDERYVQNLTQQDLDKYLDSFKKEALAVMRSKDENVEAVDLYFFKLQPGGYLSFNAYLCFHGTLTFTQVGDDGYRQLLVLHEIMEQS